MNFSEALNYISSADSYGIVPGLDNICALCKELSDPQDKLRYIHIAGTNGKGSVGTFLDNILINSGYKTGRYTSPAVMDYLEKFQICSQNIAENKFAIYIEKVKKAVDSMVARGLPHPTVFEIETAIAFCYFADEKCDIVLLEVGMGGKNDATNIINNSLLSIITSISSDHTQFLGNTIQEITLEKSGIIKDNGNVVTISQVPEITDIIRKVCEEKSATLKISKIYNIRDYSYSNFIQTFSYENYENIKINMLGKFQIENAIIAIDACKILSDLGYKISDKNIYDGLYNSKWQGRFEIIRKNAPLFIIDGAHNKAAAIRLRESIDIYFSDSKIVYIMGMFKDKDYAEIAKITAKRATKIYTIDTKNNRSLTADALAKEIKNYNSNVTPCESIINAVENSLKEQCDVIIAFGSLSFLNEIKRYVNEE